MLVYLNGVSLKVINKYYLLKFELQKEEMTHYILFKVTRKSCIFEAINYQ